MLCQVDRLGIRRISCVYSAFFICTSGYIKHAELTKYVIQSFPYLLTYEALPPGKEPPIPIG
jgi:hypothetical protein